MPSLNELRRQYSSVSDTQTSLPGDEEILVPDSRHGLRPNQILEQRFSVALLREHAERASWARIPQTSVR